MRLSACARSARAGGAVTAPPVGREGGDDRDLGLARDRARASASLATTGPWRTSGYMNGTP